MLLWLRPFKAGDHIEVISGNPIAGSVKEIGLFAVLIEGDDGARLFAPNSTIWNFALRNRGGSGARPVSLSLDLPREADADKAKTMLAETIASDGRVLKTPAPAIFADPLDNGGFSIACRLWTTPAYVADIERSILAQVKRRLNAEQIARSHPAAPDSR